MQFAMAEEQRITKQYLLEHLDDNELDLSVANLSKVPVKEVVSAANFVRNLTGKLVGFTNPC